MSRSMERGRLSTILSLVGFSLWSCGGEPEWTGLEGRAKHCVIVVFDAGASTSEISSYLEAHTQGTPRLAAGTPLRDEIVAVIQARVGGQEQEAYQICFRAGPEAREVALLKAELEGPAIVDRLIEAGEASEGPDPRADAGFDEPSGAPRPGSDPEPQAQ